MSTIVSTQEKETTEEGLAVAHRLATMNPPTALCGAFLIGIPAGPNPPVKCSVCDAIAMWWPK